MTATLTKVAIPDDNIPGDEAPETVNPSPVAGPFNPEFPDSTPEAPYGYFDDGRPRKRRPKGSGKGTGNTTGARRMPASESLARSAAGVLATGNKLVAIGLHTGHMPLTAEAINQRNGDFEQMAYEALLADPILCKKIVGVGATGGKTGLIMAYAMLGLSIVPTVRAEISERRSHEAQDED